MKKNPLVILAFLFLGCSSVKVWNGSNFGGMIHASFEDLNGTQKLALSPKPHKTFAVIRYKITATQGVLKIQIKSNGNLK
jgi:hypothetical protein